MRQGSHVPRLEEDKVQALCGHRPQPDERRDDDQGEAVMRNTPGKAGLQFPSNDPRSCRKADKVEMDAVIRALVHLQRWK